MDVYGGRRRDGPGGRNRGGDGEAEGRQYVFCGVGSLSSLFQLGRTLASSWASNSLSLSSLFHDNLPTTINTILQRNIHIYLDIYL